MRNYVIMFNLLMILIQWIILRSRADKRKLILQVIITFIFGYCTDFSLAVLATFILAFLALLGVL